MTYQLATAKVWDGAAWVPAKGGGGAAGPWFDRITGGNVGRGSATVTADTTAHTKGAWTQLVASTSAAASALLIYVENIRQNTVDTASLVDIGVGASGSETAIVPNVAVGQAGSMGNDLRVGLFFIVPVQVPSGSRISARLQSLVTGGKTGVVTVTAMPWGDPTLLPTTVDVLGTSTATSQGTVGSASAWTQVVASTAVEYRAISVLVCGATNIQNTAIRNISFATGSSGAETPICLHTYLVTTGETIDGPVATHPVIAGPFPAGTRFSFNGPANMAATIVGIP
jgi:hypothetical protein